MRVTAGQTDRVKTLSELSEEFISVKMAQGCAKRTIQDYRQILTKFVDTTNNVVDVDALTIKIIIYFSKIPDTSAAVYNRPYRNLNAFFNWCIRQGYLSENPIAIAELHKKRDDSDINAATIEDIQKLLEHCDKRTFTGFRNWTMINLMVDTGIRTCEIVRLKDSDFNSKNGTITIRKETAKTRASRTIYLSESIVIAVSKMIKIKPEGWTEYIFPSREGRELATNELAREFRKLSKKAGVKVTPYQLRHSFATYCAANGMSVFILQQLMGHSDLRMTRRYTDIPLQMLQDEHDQFSPLQMITKPIRLSKIES